MAANAPSPPNPSWNPSESDAESDEELNDLITAFESEQEICRAERAQREREKREQEEQEDKTEQGDDTERGHDTDGETVPSVVEIIPRPADPSTRLENELRSSLALEWVRMMHDAVRCRRPDRARRMWECERQKRKECSDDYQRKFNSMWQFLDISQLMTAATNGQAEIVACLCGSTRFSYTVLQEAALRALLFGQTAVVSVLVAELGGKEGPAGDEKMVTELTERMVAELTKKFLPAPLSAPDGGKGSQIFDIELIMAVLNQQAEQVSALMDTNCVSGQAVTRLERASNEEYLVGVDCALILAVARGYNDILVRILEHSSGTGVNSLELDEFGIGPCSLMTLAVMAGNSHVVTTVIQHYQPKRASVVYECLSVAKKYRHMDVMTLLIDALRQKLTRMRLNGGADSAEGALLGTLAVSLDSLNNMIIDILAEAMQERARALVVLITDQFPFQDLHLELHDLRRLCIAAQNSSSVPILRLFLLWARGHIQALPVLRLLAASYPTMANMLLAAGAQIVEDPEYGDLHLPEPGPLSLATIAMRGVHSHYLSGDEDLVAAIDRLPISDTAKRMLLGRPRYTMACQRALMSDCCGSSAAAEPMVEEVATESAEVDEAASAQVTEAEDPSHAKPMVELEEFNTESAREDEAASAQVTEAEDPTHAEPMVEKVNTDSAELDEAAGARVTEAEDPSHPESMVELEEVNTESDEVDEAASAQVTEAEDPSHAEPMVEEVNTDSAEVDEAASAQVPEAEDPSHAEPMVEEVNTDSAEVDEAASAQVTEAEDPSHVTEQDTENEKKTTTKEEQREECDCCCLLC